MYKVLIIDDDKLARKGLISMVPWEKCGMTVVGDVANGMLGLNFLKTQEVDLAVVDLSMPVLNGLDFIMESRKTYPKLQYVALSFHEDFEYVQSALRLGALDYISKLRMEEEDCSEIFLRIGKLLSQSERTFDTGVALKGSAPVDNDRGLQKEQFENMLADWQGCRWVYDTGLFLRLKEDVDGSAISLRQMERFLMFISQEIERV
ncbi:MAG: helix-turn-helix protein, partial [Eubacterium sp.]|nr:helix-turn-helix protein [Eubacterium sp.]